MARADNPLRAIHSEPVGQLMMSCEGRSIMRLCQQASALRKERIAFADALRPHRVRPSTNMRSIRDSAGPQISDGCLDGIAPTHARGIRRFPRL